MINSLRVFFLKSRLKFIKYKVNKKVKENFKSEFLTKIELEKIVNNKIHNILIHADKNTEYYKELFLNNNVTIENDRIDLSEFEKIPLLTKELIKSNYESLKSSDLNTRKWYENTSGGSTGEPAIFIQDDTYVESRTAVKILFDRWTKQEVGDKKIILWGAERDLKNSSLKIKKNIIENLKGEYELNAYKMGPTEMHKYVRKINKIKPNQILAYVESIYELSKFILENDLKVYKPKAIMTSAGTLTDEMRFIIEKAFNSKVFNRYGSREVGDIASECSNNSGLHIASLNNYVEVLREDGTRCNEGEIGEIVVTSLTNYAMPLIRYKIGDVGSFTNEKCSCGRNYPLLKKVEGRVTDNFIKLDGSKVYGGAIRQIFYHRKWIIKYQIIQEDLYNITINFVVASDEKLKSQLEEEVEEIKEKIKEIFTEEVSILVNYLDEIEKTSSGKFRFTISKIK